MSTDAELIAEARALQFEWFNRTYAKSDLDARASVIDSVIVIVTGDRIASALARLASALEAARAEEREACIREVEREALSQTSWATSVSDPAEKKLFEHGRDLADGIARRMRVAAALRNRTPSPPAEEKKT